MNALLWVIQTLLAGLYVVAGFTKVFMFDKFAQQVPSTATLPKGVWIAIGLFELLCSAGLLLPGAIRMSWPLAAFAAAGLAIEGLVIGVLHGVHSENSPMIFTLVLAALAAFAAYGRFTIKPL